MTIFEHKIEYRPTMARCQWPIWGCGTPLILQIRNLEHLGGQLGPLAVPQPQGSHDLVHHEVSLGHVLAGHRGEERGEEWASPEILNPVLHLVLAATKASAWTSCPRIEGRRRAQSGITPEKTTWKLFSLALWNYIYNLEYILSSSYQLSIWIKS